MAVAPETEIKLVSTPHMLDLLKRDARFQDGSGKRMLVSTYYDTHDSALARAGVRLRVRNCDGRFEQTMKQAHGERPAVAVQLEHNCRLEDEKLDLGAFPPSTRRFIERMAAGRVLEPVAATRVEREIRNISYRHATIEAAFDSGTIEAQGRSEPICELELELKRGRMAGLLALARDLPLGPDLAWSASSKGARAIGLAADLSEKPVHAAPIMLRPIMTKGAAFRCVAWNCLDQLLRNYRLILAHRDAEALHQCRVALRRLRIAADVFGTRPGDDIKPVLAAQWKAVARELGSGRTIDVLKAQLAARQAHMRELSSPETPLLAHMRERAYDRIVALISGASFQRMLFDTALWIEASASKGRAKKGKGGTDDPLVRLAGRTIAAEQKRIGKRLRNIEKLGVRARHRLRIKVKRLRYEVDFFAPLRRTSDNTGKFDRFLAALETLQDRLGDLNDIAPARPGPVPGMDGLDPIEAAEIEALTKLARSSGVQDGSKLLKEAARAGRRVLDLAKRLD